MASNDKQTLTDLSVNGEDFLSNQYDFMLNNPEYDLIEIEYPYLTYFDVNSDGEDITFVTGKGIVNKVHSDGGWILL